MTAPSLERHTGWDLSFPVPPGSPMSATASDDHVVNGAIAAQGEEFDDRWRLEARDNVVYVLCEGQLTEVDPADDCVFAPVDVPEEV